RARRDTPRDAAAPDEVRRTQWDRLARRPVVGVRVQQFGPVRNLRPALSERRRRSVAGLDGGWDATTLGAERQGTVLCRCRRDSAARSGGGERRDVERRHADEARQARLPYRRRRLGGSMYDVSPDGRRFLMIKAPETDANAAPPALIVVQHWDEELKRLVPPK